LSTYFFLIWTFFIMLYNILLGFYSLLKESFWGYHDRITEKIDHHTIDSTIYGQDDMLVRTLKKQQQELEDIMGQYVFYRFCERMSVFLTQIDMVMVFCISLATAVFIHSAYLAKDFLWMCIWIAVYTGYMWYEVSGSFIKFEVWATNLFLKQYKVLTRSGGAKNIIEAKKENKKVLRYLYLFFILPLSAVSTLVLFKFVIYPLLPALAPGLQKNILILWAVFLAGGITFVIGIFVFIDKVLNLRLRYTAQQIFRSFYSISIYIFLSLIIAAIISVAKYLV